MPIMFPIKIMLSIQQVLFALDLDLVLIGASRISKHRSCTNVKHNLVSEKISGHEGLENEVKEPRLCNNEINQDSIDFSGPNGSYQVRIDVHSQNSTSSCYLH